MARRPTLSPSRISTYLACPTKYFWTHLDERGRWYLRSKSYFSFGTTLHKVLQRFHDANDAGVTTVHEAVAAVEENWVSAGYQSSQEMQEALSEGKAIVSNYVEEALVQASTATTILVERQLRLDLGPFVLIGRIDRLDEHEDGSLEIVDYKSGRSGVTNEDVASDVAMSCYQLLVQHHYPDRPVRATIIPLRGGSKATASLSSAELDEFRRDLIFIGQEILNRDWEYEIPVPKALCPRCDFLPLCRKHPEFEVPETIETRQEVP